MTVSESFGFHSRALFDTVQLATNSMLGIRGEQSGNILFLRFDDGHLSTLNRHDSIQQIWLSDGPLSWHFEQNQASDAWEDVLGRGSLLEIVCAILARRLGHHVAISA